MEFDLYSWPLWYFFCVLATKKSEGSRVTDWCGICCFDKIITNLLFINFFILITLWFWLFLYQSVSISIKQGSQKVVQLCFFLTFRIIFYCFWSVTWLFSFDIASINEQTWYGKGHTLCIPFSIWGLLSSRKTDIGQRTVIIPFRIFFSDNTRVRIYFFISRKVRNFIPEFNIRLYDKNSESDYFFFSSTKIRIFFSVTLGIRIFF